MALALPIEGLTPRVQEIGRIRMGEKNKSGYPTKLKTFRLTSNDRKVLEAAAALYGGSVAEWKDAPDEGMFQVVTAASELDILVPRSLRSVSQAWELWQGGTCERRCDGRTEELSGSECICGPDRGSSDDLCDIVTRLSVILPRIPGLGVWRLDTGGWNAATTIPSTLDLLLALDQRPMVPAVLRAVQASSKARDPKTGKVETHRFVRAQLDAPGITIGQLVGAGASEPVAQLDAGERPAPPTAEERVAARRAEIEAAKATTTDPDPDVVDGEAIEIVDQPAAPTAMTTEAFLAFLEEARIDQAYATAVAKDLFPGVKKLDDVQRAALAAALVKE